MTRRGPRCLLGLVLVAVVLPGCAVGTQSRPQVLSRSDMPPGLLATNSTTTSTTPPYPGRMYLYFQGLQRLVAVTRTVAGPVTVSRELAQLAKGPTQTEAEEGLTSPVSSAAPFTASRTAAGVVNIDVASSFTSLAGASQIAAVAQLVYAVTSVPGVTGVTLSVGGQPTEVPKADGSLSTGPLTRADYAAIGPRPPVPG